MKILITGASGYIAKLLIRELSEHELFLWSRSPLNIDCKHYFCLSEDLCDLEWWRNVVIPDDVEIVIHLAEAVKENLKKESIDIVVSSHCAFLSKACSRARVVIYPDTAYRYDSMLGRSVRDYAFIKRSVIEEMEKKSNFAYPVIHPIIDGQGGLAKFIAFQAAVPFFNIFCCFHARLPYLTKGDLILYFKNIISEKNVKNSDWFSAVESIAELMRRVERYDSKIISTFLKVIIKFFLSVPMIRLLLSGRAISYRKHGESL